jgi:hypothetical protein
MKWIRIVSVGLVAFAAAACSSSSFSEPGTPAPDAGTTPGTQTITTEVDLRTAMRVLWEDHVFWTRIYIIDAVSGLPENETAVSAQRLMQNQIDIGIAIRPFYGVDAGNQLTTLLHTHIQGAVDVLNAALAHDDAAFQTANAAWYANGYDIAKFLSDANPNWPLDVMVNHMKRHLDLTLAEAVARATGDYAGEVKAYDDVVNHILTLADTLSAGIVAQRPELIAPNRITPGDENLHLAMRKLWEDHVQWTRIWLVDETSNLPDTSFAAARLLQNQVDIGNAVKPYYGDAAGNELANLLKVHITGAVGLVKAFESGDTNAQTAAKNAWYANAEDIAKFLAAANPFWPLADLERHMKLHLDQTLAEAAARLEGQWSTDVTAYDVVVTHIRLMSDFLADGIALQFPQVVQ